ncbi:MAG: hypothetical protein ACR2JF_08960 [Iamia sp.]
MERPPADPAKLLSAWAEWEAGDVTAGRAVANLKTGMFRDVIEHVAGDPASRAPEGADVTAGLASWMEWETGSLPPEPLLVALREDGVRPLLESLAEAAAAAAAAGDPGA